MIFQARYATILLATAAALAISAPSLQAQCGGGRRSMSPMGQSSMFGGMPQQYAMMNAMQQQYAMMSALQQQNAMMNAMQQQSAMMNALQRQNAALQNKNGTQPAKNGAPPATNSTTDSDALVEALKEQGIQLTPAQLKKLRQQQVAVAKRKSN